MAEVGKDDVGLGDQINCVYLKREMFSSYLHLSFIPHDKGGGQVTTSLTEYKLLIYGLVLSCPF